MAALSAAALSGLKVSLIKATPVEDHSTYRYHIACQYEHIKWELTKRFSEFDALLQSLAINRYGGLPKMPSKTLYGSPTDVATVDTRKEQLRILLNDLLLRPDTRSSLAVQEFLELDSHVEASIRSVQPNALHTFEDPRFGVSGICAAANLMMVTHEDSTHLSRLGRVWSVVEPDELGAFHLFCKRGETSWKRIHSRTYGNKVCCLCWEEMSRQVFVGLEDGKIEVHALPADAVRPTLNTTLDLHHKSPITFLAASPRRLFSLGFDTAMRVIDVNSKELRCGGRLVKRLRNESDYLTTGCLDDLQDRAFVATSGGDIFILDVACNPPGLLHQLELGAAITKLCICLDTLLVASGDSVTVFKLEEKSMERRIRRERIHRSKFLYADEAEIQAVTTTPDGRLIFGGYSDGSVAIWTSQQEEAYIILKAHSDTARQLVWLDGPPCGPVLLSGGGDGKVITWSLGNTEEDYTFWNPNGDLDSGPFNMNWSQVGMPATAPASDTGTLSAFEPTFSTSGHIADAGNDVFAMKIGNSRANPQALKRDDESDSDNDLRIF